MKIIADRHIHKFSHCIWENHPNLRARIDKHLWNMNLAYGGPREVIDRRGEEPIVGFNNLDRDFKLLLRGEEPYDARSNHVLSGAIKALDDAGFVATSTNSKVRHEGLRLVGKPDAVGTVASNIAAVVELKVVKRFRATARAVDAAQLLCYALCRSSAEEIAAGNVALIVIYVFDSLAQDNTRVEWILEPGALIPVIEELAA